MKRTVYLTLFVFLGALTSFLVHAAVEIWYVGLLVNDFSTYGLGLSWETWFMIHHVGAVILLAVGLAVGYGQGRYWWRVLYIEGQRAS